ncbi:LytR C-terminal domain-containing protein [Couchioplanes caeruleus]|uniref:LytR C-terminal domain-containing protein n=1 Tax=Couchioplanes caeruleus TaxID=56438 RepID=UPI0020C118B9|nr:LytR C-terminal domain-containing protein [Couchioplanes caeruleus]UQU65738.1 LytR C-terminal domain-containing protein [Couchioplanes caeruleus]
MLLDLEEDVSRAPLAPAAQIRARGRTRARRRTALAATGLTLVAAGAGTAVLRFTGDQPPPTSSPPPAAAPADLCARLDLSLPDDPADIPVRVLDGAATAGLDRTVVQDLHKRRFTRAVAAGEAAERTDAVAVLQYGPEAVGEAVVLRAMLRNEAVLHFDPQRDGVVELVIGNGFRRFASVTEVNQALVEAGRPTAPPECR